MTHKLMPVKWIFMIFYFMIASIWVNEENIMVNQHLFGHLLWTEKLESL